MLSGIHSAIPNIPVQNASELFDSLASSSYHDSRQTSSEHCQLIAFERASVWDQSATRALQFCAP